MDDRDKLAEALDKKPCPTKSRHDIAIWEAARAHLDSLDGYGPPALPGVAEAVGKLWLRTAPSFKAQFIRSAIPLHTDYEEPVPEYVWLLVDIAIQRALNTSLPKTETESPDKKK